MDYANDTIKLGSATDSYNKSIRDLDEEMKELIADGANLSDVYKENTDRGDDLRGSVRGMVGDLLGMIDGVENASDKHRLFRNGIDALVRQFPLLSDEINAFALKVESDMPDRVGVEVALETDEAANNRILDQIALTGEIPPVELSADSSQLETDMRAARSKAAQDAFDIGTLIPAGIARGIRATGAAPERAIVDVLDSTSRRGRSFIRAQSPSRKFAEEVGEPIALGIAIGIANKAGAVTDEVRELIKDAADAASRALDAAFSAISAGRGIISARRSIEDAARGVEDAARNVQDARRDITEAQRGVQDAARGIVDAQRDVENARRGVIDSRRGVEEARRGVLEAQRAVIDAQRGVRDAQAAVIDARRDVEDAVRDIEEAKRAVEDAVRGVEDAQRGVGRSNRNRERSIRSLAEAERDLQDIRERQIELPGKIAEAEARLAQERAEGTEITTEELLQVEESTRALARTRNDFLTGGVSLLALTVAEERHAELLGSISESTGDVAGAERDLEQLREEQQEIVRSIEDAEWALVDARLAVEDATRAIEEAERRVEESRRGVDDATRSVTESERALIEAHEAVIDAERGVEEAHRGVEDAQRGVEDANRAVEEANWAVIESERAVEQAVRDVAQAQRDHEQAIRDVSQAQRDGDAAWRGVEDAAIAVDDATIGLLEAQRALEEAGLALANNPEAWDYFKQMAEAAGIPMDAINSLIARFGDLAAAASNARIAGNTALTATFPASGGGGGGGGGGGTSPLTTTQQQTIQSLQRDRSGFDLADFGSLVGGLPPLFFTAQGGVATGSILANIGEGSSNELVLPLENQRGIDMLTRSLIPALVAAGGSVNNTVNVHNPRAEPASQSLSREMRILAEEGRFG